MALPRASSMLATLARVLTGGPTASSRRPFTDAVPEGGRSDRGEVVLMDEGVVAVGGKRLLDDTVGLDHLGPARSRCRVGAFEHRAHHRRRSDDAGRDAGVQHGLLDRQPEPGLGWVGRFVLRTVGGQQHDASDPCLPSDAQHLRHRGRVGARQEEGLEPLPRHRRGRAVRRPSLRRLRPMPASPGTGPARPGRGPDRQPRAAAGQGIDRRPRSGCCLHACWPQRL